MHLGEDGPGVVITARAAAMKTLDRLRAALAQTIAGNVQDPAPLLAPIQVELHQPEALFALRAEALFAALERFGGLPGRSGLLASRTAKQQRDWALRIPPVARREAGELKAGHEAQLAAARRDALEYRQQLRIALPGLSALQRRQSAPWQRPNLARRMQLWRGRSPIPRSGRSSRRSRRRRGSGSGATAQSGISWSRSGRPATARSPRSCAM